MNPALFFVHVPKCGGTAVRVALAQSSQFVLGPKYFGPRAIPEPERVDMAPARQAEIYSIPELHELATKGVAVGGHVLAKSAVEAGYSNLITTVREPRARLLSLYRYWQSMADQGLLQDHGSRGKWIVEATNHSLKEFLELGEEHLDVDNGLSNYLRPNQGFRSRLGFCPRSSKISLRAFWTNEIGDLVDEALRQSNQDVPSGSVHVDRTNVTKVERQLEVLDRETMRLLQRRTTRDKRCLTALMRRGQLSYRSTAELEREFQSAASHLGFKLNENSSH